jgi:uncharacterized protein with NAD-binding domain and iron-sulfur cluster
MRAQPDKKRVAILGGGIGALTAAFELAEQDIDRKLFDITIYTLGWRLGGKAAVGRDTKRCGRAYEHGLHVWAGFYDNAFDLVKRLYARLGEPPDAWRNCFEPLNHFTVMENIDQRWTPWLLSLPPNDLEPGIGAMPIVAPLALLKAFLQFLESSLNGTDLAGYLSSTSLRAMAQAEIAAIRPNRTLGDNETVLSAAREFALMLPPDPQHVSGDERRKLIDFLDASRRQIAAALNQVPNKDASRRLHIIFDLAFALTKGLLATNVFFHGFDAIDDIEWSDWMERNGCHPASLKSAIVRGCYDYIFSAGARVPSGVGAGTGTYALLRFILTYKGAALYALREPMGDNVIAPLYKYLRSRGVNFEFFSRIKSLNLSSERSAIDEIILAQQVEFVNKNSPYEPLIENDSTWPSRPNAEQIVNGDQLENYDLESAWTDWPDAIPERRLRWRNSNSDLNGDRDTFDIVVLAMGFEGLASICMGFADQFPNTWGKAFDKIKTTQTVALQLWLYPQVDELGWPDPQTMLTAFETIQDDWNSAPLHSWEDNSRLLRRERMRHGSRPRSLAYFVGQFPDATKIPKPGPNPEFPKQEHRRARAAIVSWMNDRLTRLWTNAAAPRDAGFRWDLLEAPSSQTSSDRLDWQYLRPNINPSERYVLSVPGSARYRVSPDATGIDNLYLAGDWVRSGLNAGCIEAAVIAGRMAARAITGANMAIPGDGNSSDFPVPISALPLINAARKLRDRISGGIGQMDAYCATIYADNDYVSRMLPPGLHLVPVTDAPQDQHPIVLLFTRQRNVRPGFVPFGGINYHEFIEIIPYVEHDDRDAPTGGPFSYMPYLLLDNLLPVMVGVNLYGFPKRLARISSREGSFDIHGDLGAIRAQFHDEGLPGVAGDFPEIQPICELVEHPLISQSADTWIYSYLDFCLETADFQRAGGAIVIGDPLVPTKLKGNARREHYKSDGVPWFRFSTKWTLSVPLTGVQGSPKILPDDLQRFVSSWQNNSFIRNLRR